MNVFFRRVQEIENDEILYLMPSFAASGERTGELLIYEKSLKCEEYKSHKKGQSGMQRKKC